MFETITITHKVGDNTQSCELCKHAIKLDDELYEWLKSSLVGIGFDAGMVAKFFDGKE
jgi:hypothetical protein